MVLLKNSTSWIQRPVNTGNVWGRSTSGASINCIKERKFEKLLHTFRLGKLWCDLSVKRCVWLMQFRPRSTFRTVDLLIIWTVLSNGTQSCRSTRMPSTLFIHQVAWRANITEWMGKCSWNQQINIDTFVVKNVFI